MKGDSLGGHGRCTPVLTADSCRAWSAPCRLSWRSRGAYLSLQPPARSVCWPGSSAQALENGANHLRINRALKADQRATRNLDADRNAWRSAVALLRLWLERLIAVHRDRQQLHACIGGSLIAAQLTGPV